MTKRNREQIIQIQYTEETSIREPKKDANDGSYTEEKLKRQAKQTIPQNKRKLSCKTALSFSLK